VRSEAPRLTAALKRRAVSIGRSEGSLAAKSAAKQAATKGFTTTRDLVAAKAKAYCANISSLAALPQLCTAEGSALFNSLQKSGRVQQWQNGAEDAASIAASKQAAIAAFTAAAPHTHSSLSGIAEAVANATLAEQFDTYKTQWDAIEGRELSRVAQAKELFFRKSEDIMIAKATAAATKRVWSAVQSTAETQMAHDAKKAAHDAALAAVAAHLAPKFADAATKALPIAVRTASKKAMSMWHPTWDGKDASDLPPAPAPTTAAPTTTVGQSP